MPDFYEILKSHLETHPPSFGDGDSVLSMLYEAFAEANPMDDGQLKQDFHELYELMNGMPLREMDKIIYPVCTLCRDHQRSGFMDGVRVGVKLKQELGGTAMIIRNAIRCNICGNEIESTHRHDFVTCKCGACSVDGGHDYLRRCFKEEGCYMDISVTDHSRKEKE